MENDLLPKMSVIIPVFNNGYSLYTSVGSVLSQTMPASEFEIILSDDGSTDDSGDICRQLAENNDNIRVLSEKNLGVSAARNLGINNAGGKYIMFLDADDTISMNTLEKIYEFFEENSDNTDVVTYRIDYVERGRVRPEHKRFQILKERAVYSIDGYKNMNILQTTINVCVKNDGSNLFDENLDLAEDQLFITSRLMKKRTIGFVPEAVYTYNRSPFSSSSLKAHPFMCFETMLYFFGCLTENFKKGGKLSPYIQSIILYNISWRISADRLIAHGLSDEEEQKCIEELRGFLKFVSVKTVCNFIYADARKKLFFLNLKGAKCRLYAGNAGYSVICGSEPVFCSNRVDIFFSRLTVRNGELLATGCLGTVVPENVTQELLINGESVPLFLSNGRGVGQPASVSFDIRKPVSNEHFDFSVRLGGYGAIRTDFIFGAFCRVNSEITAAACGEYILSAKASLGSITVEKADGKKILKLRKKEDSTVLHRDARAWVYRTAQRLTPNKKIWLYSDAAGVYGNGYLQYIHDASVKDGVKRYYIVNDPEAKKALKKKSLKRRETALYGGRKHKILFLGSEKILASYISPDIVCPFGKEPMRRYGDIFGGEIIYLQHGVMHADLPQLYAKERCLADKIVVSSPFEKEKLTNGYHYRADDLISSGMPEFELLVDKKKSYKRLLYMPSWRAAYIGGFVNNTRVANKDVFMKSNFYKAVSEFISSEKLEKFLQKNDLYLDIKSHPIFSCYDKFFKSKSDRISFVSGGSICQSDYPLLITDFSSCVFDFVYLRRPIIYFMPDYELFLSGALHSYCSLDVPLEKGFGKLTRTADELVSELKKTVKNKFKPEEIYLERMDAFFDCRNAPHRKLLYESFK